MVTVGESEVQGAFLCLPSVGERPFEMHFPETIDMWREEIHRVRDAISLWKAILRHDESFLRESIRLHQRHASYISSSANKVTAVAHGNADFADDAVAYEHAGELLLCKLVGQPDVQFIDELQPILRGAKQRRDSRFKRIFRLKNLRDAILTELKNAVENEDKYVSCRSCKKWLRISADGRRSNTRYCDDACRQADCRRRRARAASGERAVAAVLSRWETAP